MNTCWTQLCPVTNCFQKCLWSGRPVCPDDALPFLSGFIQLCLDSNFDLLCHSHTTASRAAGTEYQHLAGLATPPVPSKAQSFTEMKPQYLKGQPSSSRENLFPCLVPTVAASLRPWFMVPSTICNVWCPTSVSRSCMDFPESTYKGTGHCAQIIQDRCASKYKLKTRNNILILSGAKRKNLPIPD